MALTNKRVILGLVNAALVMCWMTSWAEDSAVTDSGIIYAASHTNDKEKIDYQALVKEFGLPEKDDDDEFPASELGSFMMDMEDDKFSLLMSILGKSDAAGSLGAALKNASRNMRMNSMANDRLDGISDASRQSAYFAKTQQAALAMKILSRMD